MQEGKRQKQIGSLLQQELNNVFQKLGLNMIDGGLISIASIKVTPDLLEARIYLSLYKVQNPTAALKYIEEQAWVVKKELTASIKHQLRRMPVLKFYADDTLENVFKMEELFKKIHSSKKE
jgi:ribosome-binding factor A